MQHSFGIARFWNLFLFGYSRANMLMPTVKHKTRKRWFRWESGLVQVDQTFKMASGKGAGKQYREKGEGYMYWFAFICSIVSLLLVFIAFASPFWYKSWSRVHSPLANVGMWHICLSGWVKPRDPQLRSYVGCWWIHSTFFEEVWDDIMPGKTGTNITYTVRDSESTVNDACWKTQVVSLGPVPLWKT